MVATASPAVAHSVSYNHPNTARYQFILDSESNSVSDVLFDSATGAVYVSEIYSNPEKSKYHRIPGIDFEENTIQPGRFTFHIIRANAGTNQQYVMLVVDSKTGTTWQSKTGKIENMSFSVVPK